MSKPHLLSAAQLEKLEKDGFLIVEDFFSPEELLPVLTEIEERVGRLASRLHEAGKIQELHADADVFHRLTLIERQFKDASVLVHTSGVMGQELAKLWSHPRLLDIIEQLLPNTGEDGQLAGHPVWNVRAKTPGNPLATVPWHQDCAYLAEGAEKTCQPTAWIPLSDVTKNMGTLRLIRGAHHSPVLPHHLERNRKGKASHSEQQEGNERSWYLYIKEEDLPEGERVDCEMKLGSLVLFNNIIPHCSGDNTSDKIRWSVDLRWQRSNQQSGFEGVKDVFPLRDAQGRPREDFWSAWREWESINRNAVQIEAMKDQPKAQSVAGWHAAKEGRDEFDTTVAGPWIDRWSK